MKHGGKDFDARNPTEDHEPGELKSKSGSEPGGPPFAPGAMPAVRESHGTEESLGKGALAGGTAQADDY